MERFLVSLAVAFFLVGGLGPRAHAECTSPFGNLNGDAEVNVVDIQCEILTALGQLSNGPQSPAPLCVAGPLYSADMNCDDFINSTDILHVIWAALGAPIVPQLDADQSGLPDLCEAPGGCIAEFACSECTSPLPEVEVWRDGEMVAGPFVTIQAGINAAVSGDEVLVGSEIYEELVVIKERSDLTLRAKPGETVILHPPPLSTAQLNWQATAQPGVYSGDPSALTVFDDVYGTFVKTMPGTGQRLYTYYKGDAPEEEAAALALLEQGVYGPGLGYFGGQWFIRLHLSEDIDPKSVSLYGATRENTPLRIHESQHITVRDLSIRYGGLQSVQVNHSSHILLDGLDISGGHHGVQIESTSWAVTVRRSVLWNSLQSAEGLVPEEICWRDFYAGRMGGAGVSSEASDRIVVEYSQFRDWFDGVRMGSVLSLPAAGTGGPDRFAIRHNRLGPIFDDALELEGHLEAGEVHDNVTLNSHVSVAMTARLGDAPITLSRNRFIATANRVRDRLGTDPEKRILGFSVKIGPTGYGGAPLAAENAHFYHNNMVGYEGPRAVFTSGGWNALAGAPDAADFPPEGFHWFNNIFLSAGGGNGKVFERTGSVGAQLQGNLYYQQQPTKFPSCDAGQSAIADWNSAAPDAPGYCTVAEAIAGSGAPFEHTPELGQTGITANPVFADDTFDQADPSVSDTPLSGSPAIDGGIGMGALWDDPVPTVGQAPDRGAFEMMSPLSVYDVIPNRARLNEETPVIFKGTGFDSTLEVTIDGALALDVTVASSRTAFVTLPSSATVGQPVIELVRNDGASASFSHFATLAEGIEFDTDTDGDWVPDRLDNCPGLANSLQLDYDGDAIGDECTACSDGIDNNGDGWFDWPEDPACEDPWSEGESS